MPAINAQPNNLIYPSTVGDRAFSDGVQSSSAVNLTPNQADSFTKQSNLQKTEAKPAVAPWVWVTGGLATLGVIGLAGWAWWKNRNTESVSKVAADTVTTAIGEHWDNPHVLAWFNVGKAPFSAYQIPQNTIEPEAVKQFSEAAKRHLANIETVSGNKVKLEGTTLFLPARSPRLTTEIDEATKHNFAKLYDYFQTDRVAFFKSYAKLAGIELIDLENTKQPETFGTLLPFIQPISIRGLGVEEKTALQWLQTEHPNIKKVLIGHGMDSGEWWHIFGGRYNKQKLFDFVDQHTQAGEEVAAMVCQTGLISAGNLFGRNSLNLKLIRHGERKVHKVWNLKDLP